MANGNVTTTTDSGGQVPDGTPAPPAAPVPVQTPTPAPPSTGNLNVMQSPNPLIQKGWGYLTEAGKILVLAAFAIYSVGFVIWHTYLGQYGITPHGLLRTEFLSAALCYSTLTFAFALPGALLIDNTPGKTERFYSAVFVVWAVIIQRLNSIFFPDGGGVTTGTAINYLFGFLVIQSLIEHGLKHRLSPRWLKFVKSRLWFFLWMVGVPATALVLNENTSVFFLVLAILFVPSFKWAIPQTQVYWQEGTRGTKALIVFALFLIALIHVHIFAIWQFSTIPKSVGGGMPEQAYLKFKTPDANTAGFFGIKEDGGTFGPVNILLHSDSEIIFIPANEKYTNARLVRSDQLAGIRYERRRPQPE